MILFKVLINKKSCHGGDFKYPAAGKWTKRVAKKDCALCLTGYHLTSDPLVWIKKGAEVWTAEGEGLVAGDGRNKGVFQRVRLLKKITSRWPYLTFYPRIRVFLEAVKEKPNLSSANLRSADLRYANLSSADLRSADLSSANLSSANLRSADLRSANLSSANLRSADLRSADLGDCTCSICKAARAAVKAAGWAIAKDNRVEAKK